MTAPYSIIIPAYNEEERIGRILAGMPGDRGQFIVVCDGDDATPEVVAAFSRIHPDLDLTCLTFARRLGKGGAVREGFLQAKAPVVGYLDADGSTSLDQMRAMVRELDGADAVIGSRWLPASVVPERQGLSRRIESRAFNLLIRILFGLHYSDTQCGAKVFKKSVIDAVREEMVSTGFEFDVELLWRLSKRGCTVREFPITWYNQGNSRVKTGDAARMCAALIALRARGGGHG